MNSFVGFLHHDWYEKPDPEGRRHLDKITNSSRNMGILFDDLLDFARLGKVEMRRNQVSLQQLVARIQEELATDVKDIRSPSRVAFAVTSSARRGVRLGAQLVVDNMVRMWWDNQNLEAPRRDKAGVRWNFRVWHDVVGGVHIERVFYWNEARDSTGAAEFSPSIHVKQLHAFIEKLVASPQLREIYSKPLRFPIERHYSDYEPFQ